MEVEVKGDTTRLGTIAEGNIDIDAVEPDHATISNYYVPGRTGPSRDGDSTVEVLDQQLSEDIVSQTVLETEETAPSPFEHRSFRYWPSDSPSWYHQHITPGNPLYLATPFQLYFLTTIPGERRFIILIVNKKR